jgi:hypothetical protein
MIINMDYLLPPPDERLLLPPPDEPPLLLDWEGALYDLDELLLD